MRDGALAVQRFSAIGKAVRGHVDDTHHPGCAQVKTGEFTSSSADRVKTLLNFSIYRCSQCAVAGDLAGNLRTITPDQFYQRKGHATSGEPTGDVATYRFIGIAAPQKTQGAEIEAVHRSG
ncbi:MAG: hypothetical protein M3N38_02650 [Pseudomonadota bacterium]|nr:hypothetical protein [Pseudomonadota bacterium]